MEKYMVNFGQCAMFQLKKKVYSEFARHLDIFMLVIYFYPVFQIFIINACLLVLSDVTGCRLKSPNISLDLSPYSCPYIWRFAIRYTQI